MKLPSFSYSKYDTHSGSMGCPLKMKYKMIDYLCNMCFKGPIGRDSKVCPHCEKPISKGVALEKGGKFAKGIEAFLKTGEGYDALLDVMESEAARVAAYKIRTAHVENPELVKIEYGFLFTHEAYLFKGALDVLILDPESGTAQVIDWKTGSIGKRKGIKAGAMSNYDGQLEVYAMAIMILYPWVQEVSTSLYFVGAIDIGRVDRKTYMRHELPKLITKWGAAAEKVMGDTKFEPRKGFWCSFCDFNKNKGGPCPVEQPAPKEKADGAD